MQNRRSLALLSRRLLGLFILASLIFVVQGLESHALSSRIPLVEAQAIIKPNALRNPNSIEAIAARGVSGRVYLPLIMQNEAFCGQFVWFRQGIDRYPGFQLANAGELWFFDEFSLGAIPAEGSHGIISNPQFMSEDFSPGIKWLMGASAITPVANCGP